MLHTPSFCFVRLLCVLHCTFVIVQDTVTRSTVFIEYYITRSTNPTDQRLKSEDQSMKTKKPKVRRPNPKIHIHLVFGLESSGFGLQASIFGLCISINEYAMNKDKRPKTKNRRPKHKLVVLWVSVFRVFRFWSLSFRLWDSVFGLWILGLNSVFTWYFLGKNLVTIVQDCI